jgi:hypothetical protein
VTRLRSHSPPRRLHAIPGVVAELEDVRVIERPDGFWLQPASGGHELGPYASLEEAIENHRSAEEEEDELEPGTALAEVEAQLGVSDWIDPETSSPAEDSVPHIEEH